MNIYFHENVSEKGKARLLSTQRVNRVFHAKVRSTEGRIRVPIVVKGTREIGNGESKGGK
jgi:hypothetical protein